MLASAPAAWEPRVKGGTERGRVSEMGMDNQRDGTAADALVFKNLRPSRQPARQLSLTTAGRQRARALLQERVRDGGRYIYREADRQRIEAASDPRAHGLRSVGARHKRARKQRRLTAVHSKLYKVCLCASLSRRKRRGGPRDASDWTLRSAHELSTALRLKPYEGMESSISMNGLHGISSLLQKAVTTIEHT